MDLFTDHSLKLDMFGSEIVTIPPMSQANIDIVFTAFRYLTGADYFRHGGNFEDKLSFQMVHPLVGVVDQFATQVSLKEYHHYSFYQAKVPAGLIARAVYYNNGPNEAKFSFNLIAHKDK